MKILGKIDLQTGKLLEGDDSIRKQPKVLVKYQIPFGTCACHQGNHCRDHLFPDRVEIPIDKD